MFGKVESKRMLTRIYPLSKNKREEVQKFVNDQLRKKYIRQSKSPQTSPGFFVEKKDGSKQIVIDYHNLNDQTVKNKYMRAPLSQQ